MEAVLPAVLIAMAEVRAPLGKAQVAGGREVPAWRAQLRWAARPKLELLARMPLPAQEPMRMRAKTLEAAQVNEANLGRAAAGLAKLAVVVPAMGAERAVAAAEAMRPRVRVR